jgi:hypothetical protein
MCRSQADGGRRCPGSRSGSVSPPADGKARIEVHTSKRSYTVIGGSSKVAWLPGEKVVSIDVINPARKASSGTVPGATEGGATMGLFSSKNDADDNGGDRGGSWLTGHKSLADLKAEAAKHGYDVQDTSNGGKGGKWGKE